jgi:hypothetical protein
MKFYCPNEKKIKNTHSIDQGILAVTSPWASSGKSMIMYGGDKGAVFSVTDEKFLKPYKLHQGKTAV